MKTLWNTRTNMTRKLRLISIASLSVSLAALGADFEKKTPMTILPTPIDFSKTVYAEAETYSDVDFWNLKDWKHLDAAGNPTDSAFSQVVVDLLPKVLYTIRWQESPRAGIVTMSYDDGSHTGNRKEETNSYEIAKLEDRNVILVRNGWYGIDVLTFNGTIGSFTQTICNAWDMFHLNRSETYYGTCRN